MDTTADKAVGTGPITTIVTTQIPVTVTKTVIETLTSTLTGSITMDAAASSADASEDGPFYFTVSNGTTIWLGSHTPAPSITAVKTIISTVAVNPVPVSNHKSSAYAQSEQTITLESISTHFLTKTVTARTSYESTSTVTYGPFATLSVSGTMGVSFTGFDGSATNSFTNDASVFGNSGSQSVQATAAASTNGTFSMGVSSVSAGTVASQASSGSIGVVASRVQGPYRVPVAITDAVLNKRQVGATVTATINGSMTFHRKIFEMTNTDLELSGSDMDQYL